MATQPLNGWLRRAFQDFSGGLNDKQSALIIKPNQFSELENAVVNDRGVLEKARGYATDGDPFPNDVDSFPRMLVNYKRGTSVDKLVVAALDDGNTHATLKVEMKSTSGDGTYSYFGHVTGTATFTNGSASVTGSGTAWSTHLKAGDKIKADSDSTWYDIQSVGGAGALTLSTTFTASTITNGNYTARILLHKDYIPVGITFNDNLVVTNGSESPMTYNNTTLNLISDADAPKGKFIEAHKSRVFMAHTSNLYWSAVNDEATWDATSMEPIFPKDGGNICAIKSFADSLIVLKDNGGVYQVVGSFDQDAAGEPDFIRRIDVPENMGVIAGRTAVVGDDGKMYFLARSGWYSMDSRMVVEKVSWNIDTLVSSIVISPGPQQNKSFVFDTKAQFDAGTHSGTRATTGGLLQSIFDTYTVTDAYRNSECVCTCIDSSNVVHVAYVSTNDNKVIKYSKWALDGTKTTETALTHTTNIDRLSMDVSAAGKVGIAFRDTSTNFSFVERVSGTWTADAVMYSGTWTQFAIKYKTSEVCFFAGLATYSSAESLFAGDHSGGAFSLTRVYTDIGTRFGTDSLSLYLDSSDNPTVVFANLGNAIIMTTSADQGASFSSPSVQYAVSNRPYVGGGVSGMATTAQGQNGLSQQLSVFADNGGIYERNYATNTTRTLSSASGQLVGYGISSDKRLWVDLGATGTETIHFETSHTAGTASFTNGSATVTGTSTQWLTWLAAGDVIKRSTQADSVYATVLSVDSDTQITLSATYTGGTSSGTYIARRSCSVANPTASTASLVYFPGKAGLSYNGTNAAYALFGANADEILVRRFSPFATWTSAEQSDSTLSSWSTYDVSGSTTNGNTVLFQVATDSASPPTTYTSVTNGSVVTTTSSNTYAKTKWYVTLVAWAGSEVDSITMNYTGAGVDAKQPVSVLFQNEYYSAITESGQSNNNMIVLYDRAQAFTTLTPSISCFCVYKTQLYAGLATRGRVVKLKTGYNHSGSAYTMTAVTKEDLFGSLELEKEAYKAYVLYEVQPSGSFILSHRLDNFTSSAGATWTDTTVTQTADGIFEIPIGDKFRSIQFKITNTGLDQTVNIFGFVVVYGFLDLR